MKYISGSLLVCILWTCGIIDALFHVSYPQRYIEREVDNGELIGTWQITADSRSRIEAYLLHPDDFWPVSPAPWTSITLNQDGTCKIDLEISWANDDATLREADALPTCTWKIHKVGGYDKQGSLKYVQGIFINFEHYNKQEQLYNVYMSEAYIVEANNELIIWNFIGSPSYARYQDFKKIDQ